MTNNPTLCSKVSDEVHCPLCKNRSVIKNGHTKNKKQQFICKNCKHHFIEYYCYKTYLPTINESIILLTKEGLGIRSTARVLKINAKTVIRRIVEIAKLCKPPLMQNEKSYEVDEMKTFVKRKKKPVWIVYALDKETKRVVSFNVGRRTKNTVRVVINSLILAKAKTIYTDKLNLYKELINQTIHKTKRFGTNRIERKNLSLRTHIKRLNRKTICYSRSKLVLVSVLKIYFWL